MRMFTSLMCKRQKLLQKNRPCVIQYSIYQPQFFPKPTLQEQLLRRKLLV